MDLLKRFTLKNLKLNKKRSIVTIIGIILSVALVCAVTSMYSSMLSSLIKDEIKRVGDYQVAFYDVPKNDISIFENNRDIQEISIVQTEGYAKLEGSKDVNKPYASITGFSKKALDNLVNQLVEGRMPQKENEILIPRNLYGGARIKYNVGDEIVLNVGQRTNNETIIYNNINIQSKGYIINDKPIKYKVVGIVEKLDYGIENSQGAGYTFIKPIDEKNITPEVNIYAKYTQAGINNYLSVTAKILNVNEEVYKELNGNTAGYTDAQIEALYKKLGDQKYESVTINNYLLMLQNNSFTSTKIVGLASTIIFIGGIIILVSVVCIKNSFDISISEKTKQYGMLKSVGATKKQIRDNVLFEAFILGIIAIPLGVLLGNLASYILVLMVNAILTQEYLDGFRLVFTFDLLTILLTIIAGAITVYLSAIGCARKASKLTPLDLIKSSNDIKINKKDVKINKLIPKYFSVGGVISYKNFKRNKRKYKVTVLSLVTTIFIYIGLNSFIGYTYKAISMNYGRTTDYNIVIAVNSDLDENAKEPYPNVVDFNNKMNEVLKLDGVLNYSLEKTEYLDIKDPKYDKDLPKPENDSVVNGEYYQVGVNDVIALGDYQYQKYLKQLNLDYNDLKDKAILVDWINVSNQFSKNNSSINKTKVYDYKVNDVITLTEQFNNINFDIEIGSITDIKPFGVSPSHNRVTIVVSDSTYNKYISNLEFKNYLIKVKDPYKFEEEAIKILDQRDFYIHNFAKEIKNTENEMLIVSIFLYGFITVVSLIGLTTIFNTISTNVQLRKQEFAVLKSVGMTKKEFNNMIRLETLFIGVKSLVIGIPLGIGISYAVYYLFDLHTLMPYNLPIIAILTSIIAIFILLTLIMKYSVSKVNKENIIETIRSENI